MFAITSKQKVDATFAEMDSFNIFVGNTLESVSDSTGLLSQQVNVAVKALQFEDIVRQLIEHAQRRMQSLSKVSEIMNNCISEGVSIETVKAMLNEIHAEIDDLKKSAKINDDQSVLQTSMGEGEVELF
jgi:methyl-accepting chemotaxis protein